MRQWSSKPTRRSRNVYYVDKYRRGVMGFIFFTVLLHAFPLVFYHTLSYYAHSLIPFPFPFWVQPTNYSCSYNTKINLLVMLFSIIIFSFRKLTRLKSLSPPIYYNQSNNSSPEGAAIAMFKSTLAKLHPSWLLVAY